MSLTEQIEGIIDNYLYEKGCHVLNKKERFILSKAIATRLEIDEGEVRDVVDINKWASTKVLSKAISKAKGIIKIKEGT